MFKLFSSIIISILTIMTYSSLDKNTDPFSNLDKDTAQTLTNFYRFWETGDENYLEASTSKNLIDHDKNPTLQLTDYDAILQTGQSLKGLSDMKHTFTEILPQADGRIVIRWQGSAIHSGEVFGLPATGRTIYFNGHDILQLKDGKIVELWHIEQLLQMTLQMQ